ncbi:hypothetical protein AURDEDRAFT_113582 [Auricularia subglabra TFB-10046 SS5]|nr:hypothetical protein AURDEDRAFT_113582 [Auricularia subglabra TFB-10046 SS5]
MAAVMRSASQRPPSPTFTTISGISNYRSDSYRARPSGPQVSPQETKAIAQTHYVELTGFLATHVSKAEQPGARANAREKLTRLTRQQFMELSTDVFDELVRRNTIANEVPFLPGRDDFHPKRNQARQKLSTLPKSRFKDLASDVYFELGRRYPEFREEPLLPPDTPGSNYGSEPSPGFNVPPVPKNPYAPSINNPPPDPYRRPSADDFRRPSGDDFRRPSGDDFRRPSGDDYRRPSGDEYRRPSGDDMRRTPDEPLRKPSGDDTASLGGISLYGRRPSNAASPENAYALPVSRRPSEREPNAGTATAAIIIPAKSTMTTEDIQTPFGMSDRPLSNASSSRQDNGSDEMGSKDGLINKDEGGYYDNNTSYGGSQSSPGVSRSNTLASTRDGGDSERLRRDYEFKIATMQNKLSALETEAAEALRQRDESEDMVQKLSDELEELRTRANEQSATMRTLERQLEEARRGGGGGGGGAADVDKLRNDMEALFEDLKDLSARNDELMSEKDEDARTIAELDQLSKEYKRKYEQAKTELRSFKATSQLFVQAQSYSDDQLPLSADGVLLDIHVTAFQSAMDDLLTTGRGNAPTKVLQPMKAVIDAVSALIEDASRSSQGQTDTARALRERTQATLNNLLTAARTHATSYGMSPVSLLDAAASHVALSVTEMGKALRIRKASRADLDAWEKAQASGGSGFRLNGTGASLNGHSPSLKSVRENGSVSSTRSSPEVSSASAAVPRGDGWAEVRPYLEAQSDQVLQAVQAVLASVRAPAPGRALGDNISQIIALVGSVVAVCAPDVVPPRGRSLVKELGDHADRLSAAQQSAGVGGGEINKEARQAIAKGSFGVANAMKELLKV